MGATRRLRVQLPAGVPPEIGVWTYALEDQRRRTLALAAGLTESELEWTREGAPNSIGALLFHCAATEMDWLFDDILRREGFPPEVKELLPYPYYGENKRLFPVEGESVETHIRRLDATRKILLDHVHAMTLEDFRRERQVHGYTVTPEWVLYHLLEHEAYHAGQIAMLKRLAGGRET